MLFTKTDQTILPLEQFYIKSPENNQLSWAIFKWGKNHRSHARSSGIHAGKQHKQVNSLTVVVGSNGSPRYHLGPSLYNGEGGTQRSWVRLLVKGEDPEKSRNSHKCRRPADRWHKPALTSQGSGPLFTWSIAQVVPPILTVLLFPKISEAPDYSCPGW